MNVKISPYVVYRRGRLPVAELGDLQFERTWAKIDELHELRAESEHCAGKLSDLLAGLVPGADESVRAEIVQLRRDIYNQRADRALRRIETLQPHLDGGTLSQVKTWYELVQRARSCESESRSSFEAEKESARAGFRRLFHHDAMAKSIQLSGDQLYQSLLRYVSGESASAKPSKVRTWESSLVNFAYRAALKPSPFGRFTEVGAFPPDIAGAGGPTGGSDTHSETTLNRVLLNWLVGGLQRVPGGLDLGILLLNSSLRSDATSIQFIGIRSDGRAGGYGGSEAVVRIKRDATVDRVLAVLADGSAPVPAVLQGLTGLTGDDAVSRKILNALLRTGLLSFRPGIDEQDPAYAQQLAEFIGSGTTEATSVLAGHLATLRELETRFPDASVPERQSLLLAGDRAISAISEVCAVGPPPEAIVRSPVYEDAWTQAPPATWSLDSVSENIPALESMWRFSSMLDYGQVKRLGLYSFAVAHFGERETLPFLEFFDRFTRLSEAEQDSVLAGRGSALAEAFATQRAQALREIGEQIVEEDGVLRLEPGAVADACAAVTDCVDPESITFRIQFARSTPSPTIVVNGVLTGYGVYFSRFSKFIEGSGVDGWTLRSTLREHLRRAFPQQVDLNAVLGFNFNLHPPLTDKVLNYPGSWPAAGEQKAYGLGDLHIRVDHANRTLALWDPEAEEALDLMPMNFLIPVGVPVLYQLLEALSPTTRYPWHPLNDIRDALDPSSYPNSSPRLVVGDVVVDRQSWTVPAKDMPMLSEVSKDSYQALIEFDEWRRNRGLPRHAFVLCQTLAEYNALAGRTKGLPRNWSDFEHLHKASVHKPMYVDFRNPYLVRSFAKSALSRDDIYVSIRECLPAVDEYDEGTGPAAAEEFFVELYRDNA
ncbi:lantibiotic dehydratase [Streptomyces sp. NPDC005202]|uniref:lantibiotic dehydratase n=1 Tax=Streptomyces sp. NPDC005202 TaxID=3157021 RepID=UPI0033BF269A